MLAPENAAFALPGTASSPDLPAVALPAVHGAIFAISSFMRSGRYRSKVLPPVTTTGIVAAFLEKNDGVAAMAEAAMSAKPGPEMPTMEGLKTALN